MQSPDAINLPCRAKINLALSVGSPNPDGLHPIASWMAAIDLADTLTIKKSPNQSTFTITPDSVTDTDTDTPPFTIDWPIEKDLAFRAHALLEQHTNQQLPINLTLTKRIPPGTGLGGGSANAAATLVALNRLFELNLDEPTLLHLAQQLGSDVVFQTAAALGHTSQLVTGTGEQLAPLPIAQPIHLVLIFPGFPCSTPDVYRAFDQLNQNKKQPPPDPLPVRALAANLPLYPDAPFNDLAEPAFTVRPTLKLVRDQLTHLLNRPVHVTGSGSTLYVLAPDQSSAQRQAQQITESTGLQAAPTHCPAS